VREKIALFSSPEVQARSLMDSLKRCIIKKNKKVINYLSSFFLLKERGTMNKTQKASAILLLIAAVVFVAGCSSQSSIQKTKDGHISYEPVLKSGYQKQ